MPSLEIEMNVYIEKKELKKLFLLGIIQVDQLQLQSLEAQKELQQMLLESLNHADKSDN